MHLTIIKSENSTPEINKQLLNKKINISLNTELTEFTEFTGYIILIQISLLVESYLFGSLLAGMTICNFTRILHVLS